MPGEIDLPDLPDAGQLAARALHLLPVVPGRLEFAIEVRQAILRERPQVVALELPVTLQQQFLRAVARLPEMSVIFYPGRRRSGARHLRAGRARRSVCRSHPHARMEIGAEIVFADPDSGERPHLKDTYPDPYSIRHIGYEKYVEAYRVYPQERSDEIARHAGGIAWKLQGCDPLARVLVVVSLNLLDPVLDAMEEPQAQPMSPSAARGRASAQSASGFAGRDHHRISVPAGPLRAVPRLADGRQPDRPAPRADRAVSRGGEELRSEHRRAGARTGSGACWRAMRAIWRWPIMR